MAETKFIFTADDSQLQSAIERVKKSLSDIGVIAESTGKTGDNAFGDLSADLGDVEQRAKETTKSFTEYSAKIKALKSEIASIESEIGNLPKDTDNNVIQQKIEQVKQLTEQMQELQKAEADQFAQNGVKFTFTTPTPYVEETKDEVVDFSATANFEKTIEQLNTLREGLAATRAEYEQISQKANTGESDFLQLAYTNDALDKTKERFTELSNAYYSANGALEQLTKELEAARAEGNTELSKQISTQIAQLSPIVTELKREYEEIVNRGDELGSQKSWLADSVKEAQASAQATRDYATEVKILNQELSGLKSQLDGINVGDKEKEAQLNERIKELQERITELNKLEAKQLESSGVKFTLVAPEATTSASTASQQVDYVSNIEQINQQNEALAQSRTEYEKVLAAIQDTDSKTLQLANTNDALASTFTRIGSITSTLQLTSDELKKLNAELEKAKANGDTALAETLSEQIEEVKAKVPALNKELQELVKTEEELKQKQRELQEATAAQRSESAKMDSNSSRVKLKGSDSGVVSSKNLESAAASMAALSKGMTQVTNGFKQMATGGAGAAKGLGMVTGGIKMMSKALLTLMANPIVLAISAIVAAIAAMGKALSMYFTQTTEGADKFAKIKGVFNSVKIVIQNFAIEIGRKLSEFGTLLFSIANLSLTVMTAPAKTIVLIWKTIADTLIGIVKGIIEGFKTGDWSTIGENIKKSVLGAMETIGEEIDSANGKINDIKKSFNGFTPFTGDIIPDDLIKRSQQIEKAKRDLIKQEKEWELEKARLEEQRSELQEVMYSGSQTEQIDAMNKMRDITNKKFATEIALAQERLRIQQEENALSGKNVTIEQKNKERELQIALNKLSVQQNNELRTMARRYKSVTNALKEQKKASEKELVNQQRENEKLSGKNTHSADVDMLKLRIKYENDVNEKLKLQQELRKKNLEYQINELNAQKQVALQQNEIDKEANIKKVYGEEAFAKWKKTGELDDTEGRLAFYEQRADNIIKKFELQIKGVTEQSVRDATEEQLDDTLTRHEQYLQGMLDAEQQYQEELARIREENGLKADTDIENNQDAGIQAQVQKAKDQRDTAQKIIKRDTGITDDTWVTELGELGAKVAGKAYDEVKKLYDEFIQSVNDDIAEVEAQKVAAENIASGGDAKTLKEEAETQLGVVETQLLDPNLSKEKKVELLQQELELKAQIAYYDAVEQGNAESLNSLTERGAQLVKVRNRAEKDAANAQQKADTKTLTRQQKIAVSNKAVVDGLTSVRDMANAVANTFGGALSKKSKKALTAMTLVADFGIDAVKGIETIVNGVSNGMIITTEGASKSMQALEKASFILTIISLAVQLIMKIVEIASQFTKSAQYQAAIDEHLEKVEELKKQQQMIEAQYATSQGSDYYKGLAKSAEAYDAIIKENKAALEDAEELYQHNLSKYGEDSEKTEEAKAQLDDLALQDKEFQNSQIEAWRGLMEELSGTSLDSFAENLADSLIEGFAMGKEGIDGVWEDTMDDLLRTMMRNQLATALKDQFQSTFDSLTDATKDGDLSQAEMQEFMNNLEAGKETAEQIAGAYYDAMSEAGLLDDADAEGSQGFGQMTQDQADTLTARFTAVQMEMANVSANTQAMAGIVSVVGEDIKLGIASIQSLLYNSNIALQIAQDQLDQMQVIADNTAMLTETNNRLKAIEQNTGRL